MKPFSLADLSLYCLIVQSQGNQTRREEFIPLVDTEICVVSILWKHHIVVCLQWKHYKSNITFCVNQQRPSGLCAFSFSLFFRGRPCSVVT
jgi:hypothetical protein